MCNLCYNQLVTLGLTLAFDEGILTGYFASRMYSLRTKLIATFIAKAKSFVAETASGLASAFNAPVLATARI
jgi:hypothetical protein